MVNNIIHESPINEALEESLALARAETEFWRTKWQLERQKLVRLRKAVGQLLSALKENGDTDESFLIPPTDNQAENERENLSASQEVTKLMRTPQRANSESVAPGDAPGAFRRKFLSALLSEERSKRQHNSPTSTAGD